MMLLHEMQREKSVKKMSETGSHPFDLGTSLFSEVTQRRVIFLASCPHISGTHIQWKKTDRSMPLWRLAHSTRFVLRENNTQRCCWKAALVLVAGKVLGDCLPGFWFHLAIPVDSYSAPFLA